MQNPAPKKYYLFLGGRMGFRIRLVFAVCFVAVVVSIASAVPTQSISHEEQVVRETYATLSFLCGLEPLTKAAIRQIHDPSEPQSTADQEVASATPTFEITNVQVGSIASIAAQNWGTRFSLPEDGLILAGNMIDDSYSDPSTRAEWKEARVHWDKDNSYTPDRVAAIQAVTVGKAVEMSSDTWTTPATYTRYATFNVMVTFQRRIIGPYTASFFFGKDARGNEVVAPQDAIAAGQLLWDVLRQPAYPSAIFKSQLRNQPIIAHWIQENRRSACSSVRADLCCANGKCALPEAAVLRDLSTPLPAARP